MEITPQIIQSISIFELFIATIFSVILAMLTLRKYKERKVRSTLFISLNFFLQGIALTFVAIDRILLTTLYDTFPGLLFHNFAVYLSLTIIFLLDSFAFDMTFPNHFNKLATLVLVLLAISGIILLFNQPTVGLDKELIYPEVLLLYIASFIFPPIIVPISVFLYYAAIVRKESKPKSSRSATMGIASIIVSISYIFELIGITGLIVIFVRLGFVIYTIMMYISFSLPKWYQKVIGWKEVT